MRLEEPCRPENAGWNPKAEGRGDRNVRECGGTFGRTGRAAGALAACLTGAMVLAVLSGPDAAGAPPDRGSPAAAAIGRHVAWLGGWAALDSLDDLTMSGTLHAAGLSGPISVFLRRDGFSRSEYDLKQVRGSVTVTPDDAWSEMGGPAEDLGAGRAEDERRSLARSFGDHLRGNGVAITHEGMTEHEGHRWEVVRFTYPNGDLVDLLLDPHDGSQEWERAVVDTRETWSRLTDWRNAAGMRFPFHQEVIAEQAAAGQTIEWSEIRVNAGIPDSVFARPGVVRLPVRIASGTDSTDWAPVDLYQHGYLYLRGKVNGVDTDLVLDSGAGMTVLDSAFAAQLGLRPAGEVAAVGASGNSTASMVSGVSIEAAGLAADSLTAAVIDLSGVATMLGRPMPVIFGKEVFGSLIVDLDYPRSRIRFLDPDGFRYGGPGHRVAIHALSGGQREIEASIEDLPPARFHLDTGNGGTLDVFRYYSEANALLDGRAPVSQRLSGGVGGRSPCDVATLRSLTIGGYTLKNVPATFSRATSGAADTRRQAGNLGAGILSRFRVLFDYGGDCLWLEPSEGWDTRPFRKDRSGLVFQVGGSELDVIYVSPRSPAEATGWKAGDRITAVDGRPIVPGRYWSEMGDWPSAAAGTEVTLTMAGGGSRRLKLEDYY